MVLDTSSGLYRANLLDDAKVQVYTVTWTVKDQVTLLTYGNWFRKPGCSGSLSYYERTS